MWFYYFGLYIKIDYKVFKRFIIGVIFVKVLVDKVFDIFVKNES